MCWFWPKSDPKYDPNKTRAENYRWFRKFFEDYVASDKYGEDSDAESTKTLLESNVRWNKGAHLDWNYTEMLRDLIDQGVVQVPITDFEVIFVEWSLGNLDSTEFLYKACKARFDWDGGDPEDGKKEGKSGWSIRWEKRVKAYEAHEYNDSNREEYIPTAQLPVPIQTQQLPQQIEYGNYADSNFILWQERKHTAFWVTGIAE